MNIIVFYAVQLLIYTLLNKYKSEGTEYEPV